MQNILKADGTTFLKGCFSKEEVPKFLDGATNVYRTKGYSVNQV